jgi:hypothetical protein
MVPIITPTEDDATPSQRFVRYTPSGSVELPNHRWVRSPKQRDFAICLDPEDKHAGWLMLEGFNGNWIPVRELATEDLIGLRDYPATNSAVRTMLGSYLERGGV